MTQLLWRESHNVAVDSFYFYSSTALMALQFTEQQYFELCIINDDYFYFHSEPKYSIVIRDRDWRGEKQLNVSPWHSTCIFHTSSIQFKQRHYAQSDVYFCPISLE